MREGKGEKERKWDGDMRGGEGREGKRIKGMREGRKGKGRARMNL